MRGVKVARPSPQKRGRDSDAASAQGPQSGDHRSKQRKASQDGDQGRKSPARSRGKSGSDDSVSQDNNLVSPAPAAAAAAGAGVEPMQL